MTTTEVQPLSNGNGKAPALVPGTKCEWWEVTERGIMLTDQMPQADWLRLAESAIGDFERTRDDHLAAMFRVGDTLNYGERMYGEEYSQAIDATRRSIRLSGKTLENAAWICGSVQASVRHPALTLSHHEVVAKLTNSKDQDRFLQMAEDEELSVSELRKRVKEEFPSKPRTPGAGKKLVVDIESEEGLRHVMDKIADFFETKDMQPPSDWSKERAAAWFPAVGRIFAFFSEAEEVAREGAKEIARFLDSPDNAPLKDWPAGRKNKWAKQLDAIGKAARRMGVTACGNPTKKAVSAEEAPE